MTATAAVAPASACLLSRRSNRASESESLCGGGRAAPDRSSGRDSSAACTAGAPNPTGAWGSRQGSGGAGCGTSTRSCQPGCRSIPPAVSPDGPNAAARAGSASRWSAGPERRSGPEGSGPEGRSGAEWSTGAWGHRGSDPPVTPRGREKRAAEASSTTGLWIGAGSRSGRSGSTPRPAGPGTPVSSSTRPSLTAGRTQAAQEPRPPGPRRGHRGTRGFLGRALPEEAEAFPQIPRHVDGPGTAQSATGVLLVGHLTPTLRAQREMGVRADLARGRKTAVHVRCRRFGGEVVGGEEVRFGSGRWCGPGDLTDRVLRQPVLGSGPAS